MGTVNRQTYAGLFLVALSTLMYEILLTRIFSVTMYYHFAFVAISVAMFGMTVGALLVYLLPKYFTEERTSYHLALSALWFSITIVVSFLTHLSVPFLTHLSVVGAYSIAFNYIVIAVPFVFSGICVCLALTRFPHQIGKLYAADLAGAAIGCLLLVYLLKITDGPTAVLAIASLTALASFVFARGRKFKRLVRVAIVLTAVLTTSAAAHTFLVQTRYPLLRLVWVKGKLERPSVHEKWNAFSRIVIFADANPSDPVGWGLSRKYPHPERQVRQMMLLIDASAGTVITQFDGTFDQLDYLRYDISNLAHHILRDAKVLVVGTGGGRDILSALAFGQREVVGVEINEDIIKALNQTFGDFSGHLDRDPRVTFVNDEARSYIARQRDQYDMIQISLIDTWAATAAGAFALTENSLYTVEAWELFLSRLTPEGVLSVSRWYFRGRPGETYRTTTLAVAALKALGVEKPRDHIFIAKHMLGAEGSGPNGIATIVVSKEPLADGTSDRLEKVVEEMDFEVVLSPRFAVNETFRALASGDDVRGFVERFPIDISAPTDDRPFFFNMLRLRNMFDRDLWDQGWMSHNMKAVFALGMLTVVVIVLTCFCVFVPLWLTTERAALRGGFPLFLFFAGIGLGFMLVEISQMQRLIIFLGHPIYGLSVVLFALLLSSGLGSFLTHRVRDGGLVNATTALLLLLFVLIGFGRLTPDLIRLFAGSMTTTRILVSIGILFPIGLLMGTAFPLGMRLAARKSVALTPWLWGINGAASVCASVFAVAIALSYGITASFWTGFASYLLAFLAYQWAGRSIAPASQEVAES